MADETEIDTSKDVENEQSRGTDPSVPSDLLKQTNVSNREQEILKNDQRFADDINRLLKNSKIAGTPLDSESFKKDIQRLVQSALERISRTPQDSGQLSSSPPSEGGARGGKATLKTKTTKKRRTQDFVETDRSDLKEPGDGISSERNGSLPAQAGEVEDRKGEEEDQRDSLSPRRIKEAYEKAKSEENVEAPQEQAEAKPETSAEPSQELTEEPSIQDKEASRLRSFNERLRNRSRERLPSEGGQPRQPLKSLGNKLKGKLGKGKGSAAGQGAKQAAVQAGKQAAKKTAGQAAKAAARSIGVAIAEGLAAIGGPAIAIILGVIIVVVIVLIATCSTPGAGTVMKFFGGVDFCKVLGLEAVDVGRTETEPVFTGEDFAGGPSNISDLSARDFLDQYDISVNASEPQTSLRGIRQSTLDEIIAFKRDCDAWAQGQDLVGCVVVVTGGTERGHSTAGTCTHGNGVKFDMRLNDLVNIYITSNFVDGGTRGSHKRYIHPSRNAEYYREPDHWDVAAGCISNEENESEGSRS